MAKRNNNDNIRVPPKLADTLTQLTDEPRVEVALRMVMNDALTHRLTNIHSELKVFRKKYNLNFSDFKKKWKKGEIKDKYSYSVEQDYWEWEGLQSRAATLKRLQKWL